MPALFSGLAPFQEFSGETWEGCGAISCGESGRASGSAWGNTKDSGAAVGGAMDTVQNLENYEK